MSAPSESESEYKEATTQRPAILVIEDDESLREILCIILEAEGYAPQGATDGRDALRTLEGALRPALITLDLRMPVMDGWAFVAAYRWQPPPHAPVLIVTALAANGHTLTADVAGVVTKPFALDDLLARVRALAPLPAEAPRR